MDAELKQKWIDALRSGQYEQGNGQLRTQDDKFCCLGVLCDIINPHGWGHYNDGTFEDKDWGFGPDFAFSDYLPDDLRETVGISSALQTELAARNDGGPNSATGDKYERQTFAEIADVIEKKAA